MQDLMNHMVPSGLVLLGVWKFMQSITAAQQVGV